MVFKKVPVLVATVWMEMVPTACEIWRLLAGDIRSAPLNAQKLLEVSVKQKLPVLTAVKCLEMSPGVLEPPRLITEACNEGVLDSEKSDNRRSRLSNCDVCEISAAGALIHLLRGVVFDQMTDEGFGPDSLTNGNLENHFVSTRTTIMLSVSGHRRLQN